jgi:uncharacterized membrane protein
MLRDGARGDQPVVNRPRHDCCHEVVVASDGLGLEAAIAEVDDPRLNVVASDAADRRGPKGRKEVDAEAALVLLLRPTSQRELLLEILL